MTNLRSHGPSLLALGYRIAPAGTAVAVVAAAGECPLYPWEIITPHKKLGKMMRDWCAEQFGTTIERRAEGTTTLFYRLHIVNAKTLPYGLRVDMADHWNRVHSFIVRGVGERSVAYAGHEKYWPKHTELANTDPHELTRVRRDSAELAVDAFTEFAAQLGMRRILTPRTKSE